MQGNPGRAPGLPLLAEQGTPEAAVVMFLMQAGRRLRTRHPEDAVDPSTFPLARNLMTSGAMRVSDLAARCELDVSTVSRAVKQLEDKGYLERTADPGDGRAWLVQLTDEGVRIMREAMRRRLDRISAALSDWSEEDRAHLQRLLTTLAADLAAANDQAESRSTA
jgi:DNA-binding MarR family transcriptional regulator